MSGGNDDRDGECQRSDTATLTAQRGIGWAQCTLRIRDVQSLDRLEVTYFAVRFETAGTPLLIAMHPTWERVRVSRTLRRSASLRQRQHSPRGAAELPLRFAPRRFARGVGK
jgi:hypothetical protein